MVARPGRVARRAGPLAAAPRRQRGTSLVEVLVTLVITAIALMGLAGMQARGTQWQRDAFDRKAAAELAVQFEERVRGNYEGFRVGAYAFVLPAGGAVPAAAPVPPAGTIPTATQAAQRDLALWLGELRRRIPMASAAVINNSLVEYQIVIGLREPTAEGTDPVCVAAGLDAVGYRCFRTVSHP